MENNLHLLQQALHVWFEQFKQQVNLHDICVTRESVSADTMAEGSILEELKTVIDEGGYSSKQVCNVDETGLYLKKKKMPPRTYISKDEKVTLSSKWPRIT